MNVADLADFLRVQCAKGCRDFYLRHVVVSKDGEWSGNPVDTATCTPEAALEVAAQMMKSASVDAQDAPGAQSYALVAYLDGNEVGRRRWRVQGERLNKGDNADPSEPATIAGVTAQLMRHNEANARSLHIGIGTVLDVQQRMIEKLSDQNDKLAEKRWELIEAMERIATAEQDRRLTFLREEKSLELKSRAFEEFTPLLHVGLAKLTGRKLAPHETGDSALDQFMGSISEEQWAGISKVLSGPQLASLMEIFKEAATRVVANAQAKQEAEAARAAKRETATSSSAEASP